MLRSSAVRVEALKAAHKRVKGSPRLAEEYLEAIYELLMERGGRVRPVDVARALNVAPSTVKKVLSRLAEKGYIRYQPYRLLELTEEGMATVEGLKRRHDVVSRLLQTLGMGELEAEVEAERIEHGLSDRSVELFELLGRVLEREEGLGARVRTLISELRSYEKHKEPAKNV